METTGHRRGEAMEMQWKQPPTAEGSDGNAMETTGHCRGEAMEMQWKQPATAEVKRWKCSGNNHPPQK
jgi:hypothetical protein